MNRIEIVTRRTFLGTMFSAGAMVLVARVLPLDGLGATATAADVDSAAWHPSV
jgi:hypothetical protein